MNTGQAWWTLFVLILLASIAKIIPVTLITKLCVRKSWSYCASIGVLMNTRGIVQLVVLNIGVQLKVISPVIFAMFVLMATILTICTSPILSILYQRNDNATNLEESKTENDLQLTIEEEENTLGKKKEKISIISTGENETMSNGSMKNNIRNDRFSFSHMNANDESVPSTTHNNIHPRKHSRMTLF